MRLTQRSWHNIGRLVLWRFGCEDLQALEPAAVGKFYRALCEVYNVAKLTLPSASVFLQDSSGCTEALAVAQRYADYYRDNIADFRLRYDLPPVEQVLTAEAKL